MINRKIIEKAIGSNYLYTITDSEVEGLFKPLLQEDSTFDVLKFQEIVKKGSGFIPSHAIARLVKRWNEIHPENKIDIEPFLRDYKDLLYQTLKELVDSAKTTIYLKNIFDDKWANHVKSLIDNYDGVEPFKMDDHIAFIGFLHDKRESNNDTDFIQRLDRSFGAIFELTPKRKTLRDKLLDPAGASSDYLGTVFEMFTLYPCAKPGIFLEYEPKVGGNRAEALIRINDTDLLLEATAMTTGRSPNFIGAIDINEYAHKIYLKIKDKAKQLKDSEYPIILFLVPPFLIIPEELEIGISNSFTDNECSNIAGIIISNDYMANRLSLKRNANSKYFLEESIWESFVTLYAIKDIKEQKNQTN